MTKTAFAVLGSFGLVTGSVCMAGSAAPSPQVVPPALVVLISVDQMRADYLDRFDSLFVGGLKTLSSESVVYRHAIHDHAVTETAPGHATLVTGTYPSRSGIVANEWWDRELHRRVYAVEDSESPVVGFEELAGRSPSTLQRSTIGDWLKEASPDSKVVSVALKDRVAVLMGGHSPDAAYWYEYNSGRYVTSEYYAPDYPDWLTVFNDSGPAHEYVAETWNHLLPDSIYPALSREDSFPPEDNGEDIMFPHPVDRGREDESPYRHLARTPFGDMLTLSLARELLEHEELGADSVPDLFLIGLSSADFIGHDYGPYSQEVMDYYVRLDRMLGDFFDFLDERVGHDRYAVVLTADHGVAPMPEQAIRMGIDARRVSTQDFGRELVDGLQQGMRVTQVYDQPQLSFMRIGLVADFSAADVTDAQLRVLRDSMASRLAQADVIQDVFTYDQLLSEKETGSPYEGLFRRSFHPVRAADVIVNFREYYVYPASLPATHGTPYPYDMHVPLLVRAGRAPGWIERPVRAVDVAPTLARLLGIPAPDDLDGEVLVEAVP